MVVKLEVFFWWEKNFDEYYFKRFTENLRIFDANSFSSYYLESRSLNEKDYHSRRYIDEYRNDYSQGCEPGHRHKDYESRYQNHSSKSSGRSGRSSYKSKHRIHDSTSYHCSHGV